MKRRRTVLAHIALGLALPRVVRAGIGPGPRRVGVLAPSTAERFRARQVVLVGHRAEMVEAGALFSYGASLPEQLRASAQVVDRVLKGTLPGSIPVEQPTRFELAFKRATARALAIGAPPTVRLRADRVIE